MAPWTRRAEAAPSPQGSRAEVPQAATLLLLLPPLAVAVAVVAAVVLSAFEWLVALSPVVVLVFASAG